MWATAYRIRLEVLLAGVGGLWQGSKPRSGVRGLGFALSHLGHLAAAHRVSALVVRIEHEVYEAAV